MKFVSFEVLGESRRSLPLRQVLPAPAMVIMMPMIVAIPVVIIVIFPNVHSFWRPVIVFAVFIVGRFVDNRRRCVHPGTVFPVSGHIDLLIPGIFDKIDRSTASAIGIAVLVPVFDVTRGDPKIDRRIPGANWADNDRFIVKETWRRVTANVKTAIKSRIANGDRYTGVGCTWNNAEQYD